MPATNPEAARPPSGAKPASRTDADREKPKPIPNCKGLGGRVSAPRNRDPIGAANPSSPNEPPRNKLPRTQTASASHACIQKAKSRTGTYRQTLPHPGRGSSAFCHAAMPHRTAAQQQLSNASYGNRLPRVPALLDLPAIVILTEQFRTLVPDRHHILDTASTDPRIIQARLHRNHRVSLQPIRNDRDARGFMNFQS